MTYRYTSLHDVIFGVANNPTITRVGDNYDWKRLTYDAKAIRHHHERFIKVRDVKISGDIPDSISHYAETLENTVEAWEYQDGSILLCAICSEFAGTFAEHKDNEVHYFLLTPKKKKKRT